MALIEANESVLIIPIQTIPNELLAAIFKAGASKPSGHCCDIPFPCIASGVNHHWREVALSLPTIWTNIVVHDMKPLKLPTLCLERSSGSTWSHEQLLKLRHVIGVCSVHLEFLEFIFTGQGINAIDRQADWVVTIFLGIFAEIDESTLRSLRINGVGLFNWPPLLFSQPRVPSLTSLHLKIDRQDIEPVNKNWASLKAFLSYCKCLQELVIEGGVLPLPRGTTSRNTIILTSLRSMALRWPYKTRSKDFSHFIRCLKAPLLTYLELVCVNRSDLNEVARRSNLGIYPALHTLRLGCCAPGPESLCPEFYELFSSVRELQLARSDQYYFSSSDSSASEMEGSLALTQPCWPALEVLSYDGCDFGWLHDIVQLRSSLQGGLLRRVRVIGNRFSRVQLEWLKEWVTLESMADSDSGLLPVSPIADLVDTPDAEDMWALLDELSLKDV
ncbi:hypothetical protein SERLA73DRAFT_160905 [Serpula lacrymans var. lacrymans S7.3]|uniref:F-box domain-containing protein n=1 Tax=Serpula lacrymans var. lacrymans (strain S7.3) TaxID=936435 RepID=F8Q0P0_SERL3|nr:hypothetical protein SERLA73DRAFT_160905 [Serpula lacrymans var. lacrymans S7.3]